MLFNMQTSGNQHKIVLIINKGCEMDQ